LSGKCAVDDCIEQGKPSLRIEIHPAPDGAPVVTWAHEACFERVRAAAVAHDDPGELGRIPGDARCVFCGRRLPVIGRHAFAFDVGVHSPPHRFWAHAECLAERLVSDPMTELRKSAGEQ
jgi:hypothetical protein